MKNRLDQAICNYGAGVISRFAAALRQEIEGVRLGQDIEAIHRIRVASRRIRSALPLFEACYPQKYRLTWRKEIRQVTRALGEARDTDVQIERLHNCLNEVPEIRFRPGIRRLILRLSQKRAGLQVKVVRALDELEKSQALISLEKQTTSSYVEQMPGEPFASPLYLVAKQAILEHLERFKSYEIYISNPEAIAELHAMRIASKQLRYTLEIFGPMYANGLKSALTAVKSAQEILGDIHDCDVWAVYLPLFLEKERLRTLKYYGIAAPFKMLVPGITYFQDNRRQFRNQIYQDFLVTWEVWKNKEVWANLIETVDLPTRLTLGQIFYPSPAQHAMVAEGNDSSTANE